MSDAKHSGLTLNLIAQPLHINPQNLLQLPVSPPPVIPSKKPSKFTPAHDAVAVALSHRHFPIVHIGVSFIQLVYGSPLQLAADAHLKRFYSGLSFGKTCISFMD